MKYFILPSLFTLTLLIGCRDMHLPALEDAAFTQDPYGDSAIKSEIKWKGKGTFSIYIHLENPNDHVQKKNYERIKNDWESITSEALANLITLPQEYQNEEFTFTPKTGYFMLPIPTEPIEANETEWYIGYEDEPAWVVVFKGMECTGGQGLF